MIDSHSLLSFLISVLVKISCQIFQTFYSITVVNLDQPRLSDKEHYLLYLRESLLKRQTSQRGNGTIVTHWDNAHMY